MGWMGGAMLLDQIDADGNGSVDKAELDRFIDSAVQRADTDGDRQLSRDEFTKLLVEVTGPAQVRAFQFFDADGDGKVALNEVKKPADRFFDRHERDGRLEPMGGHRGRGPDGLPPPRG
jgi:Ca2+-binding EF-hand superfamily protein